MKRLFYSSALFCLLFTVPARAGTPMSDAKLIDSVYSIIEDVRLTNYEAFAHISEMESWLAVRFDLDSFTNIIERVSALDAPEPRKFYLISGMQTGWYGEHDMIAQSLSAAGEYRMFAERSGSLEDKTNAYQMLSYAFDFADMPDSALHYIRQAYISACAGGDGGNEYRRYTLTNIYSWRLYEYSVSTNDSILLDTVLFYRRKCVDYLLNKFQTDQSNDVIGGLCDNLVTYQMALLRSKRNREAIGVGKMAYSMMDSLLPVGHPDRHDWINHTIGRYLMYNSLAYLNLQIADSAFYFRSKAASIAPDLITPFDDEAFYYGGLGMYEEAVVRLKKLLADSSVAYMDVSRRARFYRKAAMLFVKAGEKDEANRCFILFNEWRDSADVIKDKKRDKYDRTLIALQTDDIQRINRVEQEKRDLAAAEEVQRRNLVITGTIIISVLLLSFLVFLYNRFRHTRKQKETIEQQKVEVDKAYSMLEQKNGEILDSINYARRIQQAILPVEELVREVLPSSFIYYRPKDIVAGDFYWLRKTGNGVWLAAADCTGHGVPGAFMSLIGAKELNSAVGAADSTSAMLRLVNKGMKETLQQHSEESTRDGMDVALVRISGRTVSFSGANRPLWIVRANDKKLEEVKGTKVSIGGATSAEQEFAEHQFTMNENDMLYIFSDGYADQFGGDKQKKMSTRRFREFLLEIQSRKLDVQHEAIHQFFTTWMGSGEQVDDVLVIGIRF